MAQNSLVDRVRKVDLLIARGLGRGLWALHQRTGLDTHRLAFISAGLAYVLCWWYLSMAQGQPEWLWYLLAPGLGALATYLADHELAGLVDEHVGVTQVGADLRWSFLRLVYPTVAAILWVQAVLSGEYSPAFLAVLALTLMLFALIEYLLAIRLIASDHPAAQTYAAVRAQIEAALQAGAEGLAEEGEGEEGEGEGTAGDEPAGE